jgi:tellurite resistance protein
LGFYNEKNQEFHMTTEPFLQHILQPSTTEFTLHDQVLLALGLTLISLADGTLDDEEEVLFDAFKKTLPDWRELSRSTEFSDALEDKIQEVISHYKTLGFNPKHNPQAFALAAVDELAAITHPQARLRCFLLALDVAMASGGVSPNEDATLRRMAHTLTLSPQDIQPLIFTIATKYACQPPPSP